MGEVHMIEDYVPAPVVTRGKSALEHDASVEKKYRKLLTLYKPGTEKLEWEDFATANTAQLEVAFSHFANYLIDTYGVCISIIPLTVVSRKFKVPPCQQPEIACQR